jgi:hypothetical protein
MSELLILLRGTVNKGQNRARLARVVWAFPFNNEEIDNGNKWS